MITLGKDIKNKRFTPSLTITLANGDVINVPASGLGLSNTRVTSSTDQSEFPVGCAVGKTLQIELVNDAGQYDGVDFFAADISLSLDYGDGDVLLLHKWTVSQPPESLGLFIEMTALDEMWRTDTPYETTLSYPASIGAVWREACNKCGISNGVASCAVFSETVPAALSSDLTCRQVFGYIAALAGGNAVITPAGDITIKTWYLPDANTDTTEHPVHVLDNWITLSPAIRDITITGVQAQLIDETGEGADETVVVGSEGYVLDIGENPFLTSDNADRLLDNILSAIGGTPIRPYSGDAFFYPVAEFGDPVAVVGRDGTVYYSVITSASWSVGGKTEIACTATVPMTEQRYVDPSLRAIIRAGQLVAKERSDREQAIIRLETAIEQSSGMYKTEALQPDGSTIYYLHDRPTLAASTNIIKLTSEVIALSTDGGVTFPYGFQVTGDAVVRVLAARGISADWIDAGALVVKDADGKVLFSADVGAGTVYIDGISVSDGVVTVGVDGADYYSTVTDDGLNVYAKGQKIAQLGSIESILPLYTRIPSPAALLVGGYRIYSNGNELVIGR